MNKKKLKVIALTISRYYLNHAALSLKEMGITYDSEHRPRWRTIKILATSYHDDILFKLVNEYREEKHLPLIEDLISGRIVTILQKKYLAELWHIGV